MDPALALPHALTPLASFWVDFVEWEQDKRVRLGPELHDALATFYAAEVCVDGTWAVPTAMVRGVRRSVQTLLSRPPLKRALLPVPHLLDVVYVGTPLHSTMIEMDLDFVEHPELLQVAVARGSWPAGTSEVGVLPNSPSTLVLNWAPNLPSKSEIRAEIVAKLSGLSLFIVGGQVDRRIIALLEDELGIPSSEVRWVACEKSKPPRNLDAQMKGIAGSRTRVICVTGKMGHATSGKVLANSATHGLTVDCVESVGEIVSTVRGWAA